MLGYLLTRLAPIPENGERQRKELAGMLRKLDPSLNLVSPEAETDVSSMAKWYRETFGVPGTPEFEENIKRINQALQNKDGNNTD